MLDMRSVIQSSLVVAAVLSPGLAALDAQQPGAEVQEELARLRTRIDSLEALVRQLGTGAQPTGEVDELAELRAAAQQAVQPGVQADTAAAADPVFTGRQRSLQALNPEISANVDVFGHLNTDDIHEQNFVPREFEFSFQSALDPYSRAKIFVSHHSAGPELVPFEEGEGHAHGEAGGEGGIEIEEGYVEWVGLPAGIGLKLGKFLQRFGTLNRWHAHALPFQSRSLPHLAFVGGESLGQTGASVNWLVPLHGVGTYELIGEFTRSSNEVLFGESARASVLGHLNAFYQLSRSTDLDLGLSWLNGSFEKEDAFLDRNLYGLETAFTWRPPQSGGYRGLVVRAGAMMLDGLPPHEHDEEPAEEGTERDRASGFWSLAELRLSERWYVGGRFDWTESPDDPEMTAWLVSPTVSWWQSEFVRIRLEYDLLRRSVLDEEDGRLWLQVTFAMGPHKHETY